MFKHSLLALAITTISAQSVYAAPFMPMDARGLAMGNTGVASAKRAHAPAYNPSLLSQANENDDFSFLFPQIGLSLTDEKSVIDEAQHINDDIFPDFEKYATDGDPATGTKSLQQNVDDLLQNIKTLENINIDVNSLQSKDDLLNALGKLKAGTQAIQKSTAAVQGNFGDINNTVQELTASLRKVSDNPLSGRLGVAGVVAVPSKTFAVAVSATGTVNFSAKIKLANNDLDLLDAYVPAANGFVTAAETATGTINTSLDTLEEQINTTDFNDPAAVNAAKIDFTKAKNDVKASANTLKGHNSAEVPALGYKDNSNHALGYKSIIQNGEFTDAASSPELSSTAEVVAVGVTDIGLSFSREFEIAEQKIAFGITPKIQKIFTAHYGNELDNFEDVDSDVIDESRKDYSAFNLDVGASYRFGEDGNWMVGTVVKNLLGGEYNYVDITVIPTDSNGVPNGVPYTLDGGKVSLSPQVRGGIAYLSKYLNVAFDLDLLKNDSLAYESATQYASLGAELDLWGWFQLRGGYRTNLAASGLDSVSAGFGISPFDTLHLDLAAVTNPDKWEKEAGVALEMGLNF
ncbi:MAG: hypothetical protein RL217_99 [Pseudomonadota bacterium]